MYSEASTHYPRRIDARISSSLRSLCVRWSTRMLRKLVYIWNYRETVWGGCRENSKSRTKFLETRKSLFYLIEGKLEGKLQMASKRILGKLLVKKYTIFFPL